MLLFVERSPHPIDIEPRSPQEADRKHNPRSHARVDPAASVIVQPPDAPQEHGRRHHVEEPQQAYEERDSWGEHVLRTADEVLSCGQPSDKINRVERLEKENRSRLPREQETAFEPER